MRYLNVYQTSLRESAIKPEGSERGRCTLRRDCDKYGAKAREEKLCGRCRRGGRG